MDSSIINREGIEVSESQIIVWCWFPYILCPGNVWSRWSVLFHTLEESGTSGSVTKSYSFLNIDLFFPQETSHHNAANRWGKAQDSGSSNLQPWITSWFSWTIPHDASFYIWAAGKVKLMDIQTGLWKHGEGETIILYMLELRCDCVVYCMQVRVYSGVVLQFGSSSPPTASQVQLNPYWSNCSFLPFSPWTHVS